MKQLKLILAAAALVILTACAAVTSVKDELSAETISQLTPAHERYILLADIKAWTGVAKVYSSREFCSPTLVIRCAEKSVVIALDDTLSRLAPAVRVLQVTASADELTTYLSIGATLLLQLQAELAKILAEEVI